MTHPYLQERKATRISKNTHYRWLRAMLLDKFDRQPKVKLATDMARLINSLEQERTHDPLTGAFNRGFIQALLAEELNHVRKMGLLMLDLDHFKSINDEEPDGHTAGDRTLIEFVKILKEVGDKKITIGRWGGEEWLVLVPDTTPSKLTSLVKKIGKAVACNLASRANLERKEVTTSMGVIMIDKDETVATAAQRADALLYRAKRGGRNRSVVESPKAQLVFRN